MAMPLAIQLMEDRMSTTSYRSKPYRMPYCSGSPMDKRPTAAATQPATVSQKVQSFGALAFFALAALTVFLGAV